MEAQRNLVRFWKLHSFKGWAWTARGCLALTVYASPLLSITYSLSQCQPCWAVGDTQRLKDYRLLALLSLLSPSRAPLIRSARPDFLPEIQARLLPGRTPGLRLRGQRRQQFCWTSPLQLLMPTSGQRHPLVVLWVKDSEKSKETSHSETEIEPVVL